MTGQPATMKFSGLRVFEMCILVGVVHYRSIQLKQILEHLPRNTGHKLNVRKNVLGPFNLRPASSGL